MLDAHRSFADEDAAHERAQMLTRDVEQAAVVRNDVEIAGSVEMVFAELPALYGSIQNQRVHVPSIMGSSRRSIISWVSTPDDRPVDEGVV